MVEPKMGSPLPRITTIPCVVFFFPSDATNKGPRSEALDPTRVPAISRVSAELFLPQKSAPVFSVLSAEPPKMSFPFWIPTLVNRGGQPASSLSPSPTFPPPLGSDPRDVSVFGCCDRLVVPSPATCASPRFSGRTDGGKSTLLGFSSDASLDFPGASGPYLRGTPHFPRKVLVPSDGQSACAGFPPAAVGCLHSHYSRISPSKKKGWFFDPGWGALLAGSLFLVRPPLLLLFPAVEGFHPWMSPSVLFLCVE